MNDEQLTAMVRSTGVAQQPSELEMQLEMQLKVAEKLTALVGSHTEGLRNLLTAVNLLKVNVEQLEARLANLEGRV